MRQLNNNDVIFNNNWQPCKGRIRFENTDQSAALVYDANGVDLGTSVKTDSAGRLVKQVFLADHDYICHVDKYVGWGDHTLDTDPQNYVEIYSFYNRMPAVDITLGGSLQCVDTISALRDLHPTNGQKVMLLGYAAKFDKPAVIYEFDSTSTASENKGSYIKSNNSANGCWLLQITDASFDIRDFGVFPVSNVASLSATDKENMVLAINRAIAFQDGKMRMKFVKDYNIAGILKGQYYVGGINAIQMIDCINGAELYNDTTTNCTISDYTGLKVIGNAYFVLNNEVVYASENGASDTTISSVTTDGVGLGVNCKKLVVDANKDIAAENIEVEFLVTYTKTASLNSCNVVSNHKINSSLMGFTNMEMTDKWFASAAKFQANIGAMNTCTGKLINFESVESWFLLQRKNNVTFLDFDGRHLESAFTIPDSSAGTALTFYNGHGQINCKTGKCTFSSWGGVINQTVANSLDIVHSNVQLIQAAPSGQISNPNILIHSSTINGLISYANDLSIWKSVLNDNVKAVGAFSAHDSTFSGTIEAQGMLLVNCEVGSVIYAKNQGSSSIVCKLHNCTCHNIVDFSVNDYDEVKVTCELIGNTFTNTEAIEVHDALNAATNKYRFDPTTANHSVKCYGNKNFRDESGNLVMQYDNTQAFSGLTTVITNEGSTYRADYFLPVFGFGRDVVGSAFAIVQKGFTFDRTEVYPVSNTSESFALRRMAIGESLSPTITNSHYFWTRFRHSKETAMSEETLNVCITRFAAI